MYTIGMQCPKDGVVLHRDILQDVEVDVCSRCYGVWLEESEVTALTRHFTIPEYTSADELLANWKQIEHTGTSPKDFWAESKHTCPRDGAQMQKHYFAGSSIGVDQCQVCKGFWLDGGELQAVAEYVGPDLEKDEFGRLVVRSWGDWEDKGAVRGIDIVPAMLLLFKNPIYGVYLVGQFMMRWMVERVRW
jgi:Zn-finger nucleic acid-binding protein